MSAEPETHVRRFLAEFPQFAEERWIRTLRVLGRHHADPDDDFDAETIDPQRLARIAGEIMYPPAPVAIYDERRFTCTKCARLAREGRLTDRPGALMVARRSSRHLFRRTDWEVVASKPNSEPVDSYVVLGSHGVRTVGPFDKARHRIHPAVGINVDDLDWPISLGCPRDCGNSPRLSRKRFEKLLRQDGEIFL